MDTPEQIPEPIPVPMRPGLNGGSLRIGGTNKGGPGRPASEIRKKLRGKFAQRINTLVEIADSAEKDSDRLKALDLMAKYGIGAIKDVSEDDVKDQLRAVVETVGSAEFLSVEQRDRLLKRMEKAWKTREAVTADG